MGETLAREYFEQIYLEHEDPWNFETSPYERMKYRETLATLDRPRYSRGLELGCSIGVQTRMLAERCDELVAVDASQLALDRAKDRCRDLMNVEFARMTIPAEYPVGCFDLTVLSEVGYYFSAPDLSTLANAIREHSHAGSQLLMVHWLLEVHDYPLTGDSVHELFLARPEWSMIQNVTREKYRIDLLELRLPSQEP